ncbi:hypothetical protein GDO86_020318 [Hymenochirus boettgeri]|uniref:C3H1-type domain-containing protein n=1 Tax=Hymenochirus boettgeri TaxID=247094 RepID=A0A8T2IIA7_9PIPI|nr:hypothetical protein GDO86_020318 [Hymenochirus boettgeri]
MYRVSANKLSKTSSPALMSRPSPKAGRLEIFNTSPGSLYPSRSTTPSRYIASRAVQRSLAIIRQAKQKKEKKEYCMYYNRFGKCNRGQKCPFIHDPEKVAVCTRFLRGTCKKTDGTCSFSHKVSKDKCKKKHTLLCPDYARDGTCPNGSKCKLQHRQKKKHTENLQEPERSRPSGRQRRPAGDSLGEMSSSDVTSDGDLPTTSSGLQKLPSFISLNCSLSPPNEVSAEPTRSRSSEDPGKPVQIKPRL